MSLELPRLKRIRTPTLIQMEAVECGAASLGIILGYFGKFIPLEELRVICGVSRNGCSAAHIARAAMAFDLKPIPAQVAMENLGNYPRPMILFWGFNHFVVLEGIGKKGVFLNDPATGPRKVSFDTFDRMYTGVMISFEKTANFTKSVETPSMLSGLVQRLKGSRAQVTFVFLVGLLLAVPGLIMPVFSKVFVDEILIKHMDSWILPLVLAMALTSVCRMVLLLFQEHHLLAFETRLAVVESQRFMRHMFKLPLEFFFQRMAGDLASRVALNDEVAILLTRKLVRALLDIVMIAGYLMLMLYYDVWLSLIVVIAASSNLVFMGWISRARIDENIKFNQDTGKLMGVSANGLLLIETIKASGLEADFFAKWAGYHTKVLNAEQVLGFLNGFVKVVPLLLTATCNAVVLWVGGYRITEGILSMGALVAFQSLMTSFLQPINRLVDLSADIQNIEAGMNRLDDVFRYKEASLPKEMSEDGATDQTPTKLTGRISLKNVSFGYSAQDPPTIQDISLEINPGSRIAFVGKSGCGKSTLARLAAGLFEPWDGQILFDGKTYMEHPAHLVYNSIAMVDQDIFLFEGTVNENLCMWDNTIAVANIVKAAEDAAIHDDIAARPGSYDSPIWEGGTNFSGGQRQRLEIARALTRTPSILILDEATSALDPYTEKAIDENLRSRGCTCLVIAHRLSTIRDCDQIVVLDKGRIVEQGTHESLVAQNGTYLGLVKSF